MVSQDLFADKGRIIESRHLTPKFYTSWFLESLIDTHSFGQVSSTLAQAHPSLDKEEVQSEILSLEATSNVRMLTSLHLLRGSWTRISNKRHTMYGKPPFPILYATLEWLRAPICMYIYVTTLHYVEH